MPSPPIPTLPAWLEAKVAEAGQKMSASEGEARDRLAATSCESELHIHVDGAGDPTTAFPCRGVKGHGGFHQYTFRTTACPREEEPDCAHDVVITWRGNDARTGS